MAGDPGGHPLILASASPRRQELLALFGLAFTVEPADVDESHAPGEPAAAYVERVARAKAEAVAGRNVAAWVLGSDTAVVLDDKPLGKPADAPEARAMLERLSGQTHRVLSAVVLVAPNGEVARRRSTTSVAFAELGRSWIEAYVASGDPLDKAGAYGIQGLAGSRISRIEGSYTGVVGLPLYETAELLGEAGLIER